ncbi:MULTISPECIES: hypothetical protein [unclassified Streptomyces]
MSEAETAFSGQAARPVALEGDGPADISRAPDLHGGTGGFR